MLNFSVDPFVNKYHKGKLLTHARSEYDHYEGNHKFGRKATGITIGKGLRMNIYDKLHEVRHDDYKLTVMMEEKWLPKIHEVPESVTRIEFQAKRTGVKEYKIGNCRVDTCEEWEACKLEILKYYMLDFCRFVQGKVDRENNNQHRAKTWRVWERIFNDAIKQLGIDDPNTLASVTKEKRSTAIDFKALRKQGLACMIRAYIYSGNNPHDLQKIFNWFERALAICHNTGEPPEIIKLAMSDANSKFITTK